MHQDIITIKQLKKNKYKPNNNKIDNYKKCRYTFYNFAIHSKMSSLSSTFNVDSKYSKAITSIVHEASKSLETIIKETYKSLNKPLDNTKLNEYLKNPHSLVSLKPRSDEYNSFLIKRITTDLYKNGSDHRSEKNGNPDKLVTEIKTSNCGITTLGLFSGLDTDVRELICCPKRLKGNGSGGKSSSNRNMDAFENFVFHRFMCVVVVKAVLVYNELPEDVSSLKTHKNLCFVDMTPTALEYIVSTLLNDSTHIKKSNLDNVFNPRKVFNSQERSKVMGK